MAMKFTIQKTVARLSLGLGVALVLSACSWLSPTDGSRSYHWPYRADVVQGNVVTQEQLKLLRKGLTREQVLTVLGTPLMQHVFHADRWDYLFTLRSQESKGIDYRLTLRFGGASLYVVEAQELPTHAEFLQSIAKAPLPSQVPDLFMSRQQFDALMAERGLAAKAAAPAASTGVQP